MLFVYVYHEQWNGAIDAFYYIYFNSLSYFTMVFLTFYQIEQVQWKVSYAFKLNFEISLIAMFHDLALNHLID